MPNEEIGMMLQFTSFDRRSAILRAELTTFERVVSTVRDKAERATIACPFRFSRSVSFSPSQERSS
jgi:hypothetical protein